MLHLLMDTDLDVTQQDYVKTAQDSGKALVSLINEVLDQAKIESGKLELEAIPFNLRAILDDILSLFSGKSQEKGLEVIYASNSVVFTILHAYFSVTSSLCVLFLLLIYICSSFCCHCSWQFTFQIVFPRRLLVILEGLGKSSLILWETQSRQGFLLYCQIN